MMVNKKESGWERVGERVAEKSEAVLFFFTLKAVEYGVHRKRKWKV